MKLNGTLVRIEPNGFGVVKLDQGTDVVGVFTAHDRSPEAPARAFRQDARVTADAAEQHGNVQYLSNVTIAG